MRYFQRFLFMAVMVVSPILQEDASAQFVQQGDKLVGVGGEGRAYQGVSVSISPDGSTAIMGGHGDNHSVGAAWVFTQSGGVWNQEKKLVGTGSVGGALQGSSVSLSADGNTAIVGGRDDDGQSGAAWVYTRTGGVWSQQGEKLVGTGAVGDAGQGFSVSISADGNTAIVGGHYDNSNAGAAWVFVRSGGVWSQQGNKLVGTGAVGSAEQGSSVSLSADGNTAVVGGYSDNAYAGAAWVYIRSGGVWSQQGNKLVGTGAVGSARQGFSVSISADGNTAIVGGHYDNSNAGAAWVFVRSGGVWSQQGNKLVGTGAVGSAERGYSVSLSADGNTAAVGGGDDNNNVGATWVFVRSGGVWSQQGNKLVGTGAVGSARQGYSVSLSADGNTAIVGGPVDKNGVGAAWAYTRSAGVWSQHGDKLVGTGAVAVEVNQGTSTSLSADGNTAVVGGAYDGGLTGAAWVYTRSGGVWTQQGGKLVGTGSVGGALQGLSVSLSADGNTAIVGGYYDNNQSGAVWVFTRSGGVWSQQGNKLVGTGAVGSARQGYSVSLSADGNTAIAGGDGDNGNVGAVWVFTRSGGVWSQQGNKLVGADAVNVARQGISVSLSADGNTAIVGGHYDNSNTGAAWVYTRSGGVWSQQGNKLVGTGAVGSAKQGYSVSLSADGNTAVVGGYSDNAYAGAAWVFTRSGGVWSQQGNKLVGTGVLGSAYQGISVSLSDDGNTAIVGGDADSRSAGAAWVFTRSGGVWYQEGDKLVGTGAVGSAEQGYSVSISGDGGTAIVGGPYDNGATGAAWVYIGPATLPGKPTLLEPSKDGLVLPGSATFKWRKAPVGGGRYWFELATDSLFLFKVVDSTLTDTVRQATGLTGTKTYWWRVCAWNPLGWGQFSDHWNFTVVDAPDKVVLDSPPDRSTVPDEDVRIAWFRGSPYHDRFWCEIASDSLFTYKIVDSVGTDTLHVFPVLTAGTYWWKVKAHNIAGWGAFSDVWRFSVNATGIGDDSLVPKQFALDQNYPNPFNPSTTIKYDLPKSTKVRLSVFDMLGREVSVLVNEVRNAGVHEVTFDGSNLTSGVYFYRLQAGDFVQTKQLVLLR